jgi:hypothetical protein
MEYSPESHRCDFNTMKTAKHVRELHHAAMNENHVGIYRLAEQLDRSPHDLATDILTAGIQAVDGALGELRRLDSPLHLEVTDWESSVQYFARITETLDSASPAQLLELEAEGEGIPQAALWDRTTRGEVEIEINEDIAQTPRTEAGITLPSNIVAAITESLAAVGADETLEEFVEDILGDMLTDRSGFFESMADFDPATETQLVEIRRKHGLAATRSIQFPAAAVDLLEELLKASGTGMTIDQYAEEFLQQEILASLNPLYAGTPELLAGSYQLEPSDIAAMAEVTDRWLQQPDRLTLATTAA